jgi:hypothetical protein
MTTKIPLKDEADNLEQTPRKRRGRPRKSDILDQNTTPNGGSPGHTPGPGGASAQKRKRGRPRKHFPEPDVVHITSEQVANAEMNQQPVVEPEPRWSPLNLGADGESDDDLPDDQGFAEPIEGDNQMDQPANSPWNRSPQVEYERTYDTPNVHNVEGVYRQHDDDNIHSTPSKMPSPSRGSQIISPDNTLYAGHTPRRMRLYPTPTSSSLVDEERQEQGIANAVSSDRFRRSGVHTTNDPTDEHREFDSIMESEGFSMVSLDTLPSAKQHGLNANPKVAKGALKPFLERENNGVLKRKASVSNQGNREDTGLTKQLERSSPEQEQATTDHRFTRTYSSPTSPALVSAQTSSKMQRRPTSRFVRLIRAGIALESALRRPHNRGYSRDLLSPEMHEPQDRIPDLDSSRRRLELLFSDFDSNLRHELQAALTFGQLLAMRRIQTETEKAREAPATETISKPTPGALSERSESRTPSRVLGGRRNYDTPGSEMRRRMTEWQQEREAISREIRMANSSQVIVIDSDGSGPSSPEGGVDAPGSGDEHDWGSDIDRGDVDGPFAHDQVEAIGDDDSNEEKQEQKQEGDDDDDDGYEDIWQQEANERGDLSDRSLISYHPQDRVNDRQESSPLTNSPTSERSAVGVSYSPAYWTNGHDKVPFLGKSRISKLREQDVDLSTLLRAEDTPKRSRYYYGKSSPSSTESGRDMGQLQSTAAFHGEEMEHGYEEEEEEEEGGDKGGLLEEPPQSEDYLESSPYRAPGEETFQIDPTTNFENARQHSDLWLEGNGDENISNAVSPESQTVHETSAITPKHPPPSSAGKQASSWLQKISSLTPRWLKAPKRKSFEHPLSSVHDETSEDEDEQGVVNVAAAHSDDEFHPGNVEGHHTEEMPRLHRDHEQQSFSNPLVDKPYTSPSVEAKDEIYERPLPLAVSDYFSDDHYILLRRLYRLAKRHPERFPYYPGPGRSDIIGDWIWTSDGLHGVPITERQFAIIDRFVQELAKADILAGGTGQVGWTEADLHRRLISIIIGEQIREEANAQLYEEQARGGLSRRKRAPRSSWY